MTEGAPLRVLSIAHSAVTRDLGRLRYHPLSGRPDLDVHLLVPQRWHQFGRVLDADPPDDPGVTVHIHPISLPKAGPMSWYLHFYPALRALVRELRPDVIHLWEEPWSAVAFQACRLKGDAALVLEVDQNIQKRLPPPFEAMRRHVLRRTSHVLSRSPDATTVVRANGYRGPVSLIGYGVDVATFHPPDRSRREAAGLRLGYVGRLVEEKGVDDALDALARRPGASLALLGEGPHEAALRRKALAMGLQDRVTFQPWATPPDVAAFMRGLDVAILLTRTTGDVREQFGRVVIEAQACGVPVIGSKCGAIPDVVGAGGWIVPERDPEALAQLLDHLIATPDDIIDRGEAARRNVASRFTYAAVADVLAATWISARRSDTA